MALEPGWGSVHGADGAGRPYRARVRLRLTRWGAAGTPMAERASGLGVEPDTADRWLVRVLEAWRALEPDTLIEPWDFHYGTGEARRLLSPRIPPDSLRPTTERSHRARRPLLPRPGRGPGAARRALRPRAAPRQVPGVVHRLRGAEPGRAVDLHLLPDRRAGQTRRAAQTARPPGPYY